jgi:hypothetical protein
LTTKKPPPPSYRPTAGFASVTEAVRHFADQGKSPKEIADLTGSTTEAVRGLMQRHRQVRRTTAIDGLTWPQRDKIRRTYLAYLDLMAEGLGTDRDTVHHLCRGVHVNKEPALPPEQKVDEAEPARAGLVDTQNPEPPTYDATVPPRTGSAARKDAGLVAQDPDIVIPITPKPEPKSMMVMKLDKRPMDLTGDGRFVTLKARSGAYLALDGSRLIEDKRHAYRGTPQQAQRMRENTDPAWGLQIIPYSNQKG